MIPYSRPKRSDFYTLSQTKLLENHTLHSGTYTYSLYIRVPPPPSCSKPISANPRVSPNSATHHACAYLIRSLAVLFTTLLYDLSIYSIIIWSYFVCGFYYFKLLRPAALLNLT